VGLGVSPPPQGEPGQHQAHHGDIEERALEPGRIDLANDLDTVDHDAGVQDADPDMAVDRLGAVAVELAAADDELQPRLDARDAILGGQAPHVEDRA